MDLSSLRPRPGAKHRVKRLGCGESSGRGKTCGKGHKGQKARSGGSIRLGFEGGQMPLARKIPKRGFNNTRFRRIVECVNLGRLPKDLAAGSTVDLAFLADCGLVSASARCAKLLGGGECPNGLAVRGVSLSSAARAKILARGGTVE
jgi:large subunit ribosomal protein L15